MDHNRHTTDTLCHSEPKTCHSEVKTCHSEAKPKNLSTMPNGKILHCVQDDNDCIQDDNNTPLPTPGKQWFIGDQEEFISPDEEEVLAKVVNRTFLILVIYDIVDNKRRNKIAKKLLGYGERVQLSAFECHLSNSQYHRMIAEVLPLINEGEDLLRVYKLTGHTDIQVWGTIPQTYDEDVVII